MSRKRTWFFGKGKFLTLTLEEIRLCSHQGECWEDVKECLGHEGVEEQMRRFSDEELVRELEKEGAWTGKELIGQREENEVRLLWLAACGLREEEVEVF